MTKFSDPAALANRSVPVHRWAPWIAGYSQPFVADAIDRYAVPGCTVLDPFAGVGTTLLEANFAGHDAVGFEINPYAALATKVKLNALRMSPPHLRAAGQEIENRTAKAIQQGTSPRTKPPEGFRSRGKFYSDKVLIKVLHALDVIAGVEDSLVREACRLAFASTMVEYSNYSYEPSLGRRVSAGKPEVEDYPVQECLAKKLNQMADDCEWAQSKARKGATESSVFLRSFLDEGDRVQERSVHLLLTSPPYLNNYHYNRNTRPQLYWLGFCKSPKDTKKLEEMNFGTYWQNARGKEEIPLDLSARDKRIVSALARVRRRRAEDPVYGGPGWANYATQYFNDCAKFVRASRRILAPEGAVLVVIGNSILQGVHIPTDEFLGLIAEANGLRLVDIHKLRKTRVGNSIVNSTVRADSGNHATKLYESVVELRHS